MLEKFYWNCPRLGCKREIVAYSQSTVNNLREIHEAEHQEEVKKNIENYERSKALAPLRDYNKLKITRFDRDFLRTRFIKIDEDMEIQDGTNRITA